MGIAGYRTWLCIVSPGEAWVREAGVSVEGTNPPSRVPTAMATAAMAMATTVVEERDVTSSTNEVSKAPATWLTQEAHDRLRAELENLTGPARAEVVKKIESAREEGDLRENGGYHAAKEEQGRLEVRIRQLTQLLREAKVGAPAMSAGVAGPGMVVTVRFEGDDEPERFLIGSRQDTQDSLPIYSAQSPLGRALTGQSVGSTVSYELPNGNTMTVELLEAEPYTG